MNLNLQTNYEDVIKKLTSSERLFIDLGLERISKIMDLLGNPQDKLKCIQVAGTNGKGSVCTILASILSSAGYKTGLYTSPHIFDYTERIKINTTDISKDDFSKYCSDVIETADKHNIKLTEFEILTAMMYKYFSDNKADVAIIETGLGGRFDATNILKSNLCSIITHIDLDHTDMLGNTKEQIAFEKAGIIKPDSVVITSEGYEIFKDTADKLNSILIITNPVCETEFIENLALKGEHQSANLSLAICAIKTLFPNISDEIITEGLRKVKNPCRFQYIKDKNLIIDGAHNPNCFKTLRENLDKYFPDKKRQYIFGCLNTKDYEKMLSYIKTDPLSDNIYIYTFNNPKSCSYEQLSEVCPNAKRLINPEEINYNNKVLTVICGSFYMINELLEKDVVRIPND